jgi:hypothetical protein
VVLGGLLLGIEAARAMHRSNIGAFLAEHRDCVMPRQLHIAAQTVSDWGSTSANDLERGEPAPEFEFDRAVS